MSGIASVAADPSTADHDLSRRFAQSMSFSLFCDGTHTPSANANDHTASAIAWEMVGDAKAAGPTGRPLNSRASPFLPSKPLFGSNDETSVAQTPFFGAATASGVGGSGVAQSYALPTFQTSTPQAVGQQLQYPTGPTVMRVPQVEPRTGTDAANYTAGQRPGESKFGALQSGPPTALTEFRPNYGAPAPAQASSLLTSSVAASMSHSHIGMNSFGGSGGLDEKELLPFGLDNHAAMAAAAAVVDDENERNPPGGGSVSQALQLMSMAMSSASMQHRALSQQMGVTAAVQFVSSPTDAKGGNNTPPNTPESIGAGSASDRDDSPNPREQSARSTSPAKQQQKKQQGPASNGLSDLYKTEICQNWLRTKNCSYGNKCHYAHGKADMRARKRIQTFKTQPCADPARAGCHACTYSMRCNYCHPGEAIRRGGAGDKPYYDADYAAALKKDFPHIEAPFGVFV